MDTKILLLILCICCVSCCSSLLSAGGGTFWFMNQSKNYYIDNDDKQTNIKLSTTSKKLKNVKQLVLAPTSIKNSQKVKLLSDKMEFVKKDETYDETYTTPKDITIQLVEKTESETCPSGKVYNSTSLSCQTQCSNGEVYDSLSSSCKPTCSNGQVYESSSSSCKRKFYKCQVIKIIKNIDLTASGDGHLSLLEFEAYDESGTNIALNKTATSSSNYQNNLPGWAVDGNKSNTFHTGNNRQPEWWQVDFGSEKNITKIKIWRQTNSWSNRLNGAKIQLIASNGTVVHEETVPPFDSTKQLPYEIEFNFDKTSTTKEKFKNIYLNKNYSFL